MHALIIVDVQRDFCPGGNLAVPEGDQVIPIINAMMPAFDLVVATQDWHPASHQSFASHHPGHRPGEVIDLHGLPQVLWPDHCLQGSDGAALHPELRPGPIAAIIRKGMDPTIDSYSGFFDNGRRKTTGLKSFLNGLDVQEVTVVGLATDYCVAATAIDAASLGFRTWLYPPACRAVNLAPNDGSKAIARMQESGVSVLTPDALSRRTCRT